LKEHFAVLTVSPDRIEEYINDAKVLGIHTMDPFGLGPASSTLAAIFKREPYLAKYFHVLISIQLLSSAKERTKNCRWEALARGSFVTDRSFVEENGIDCIVEGEVENIIGKIFRAALDGNEIPKHYEVSLGETPSLEEIPDMFSLRSTAWLRSVGVAAEAVEFCNVTLRPLRWYPLEKIKREININVKSGMVNGCWPPRRRRHAVWF